MKFINSMYFKILLITISICVIYYTNYEYKVIIHTQKLSNYINNKLPYSFESKEEKLDVKHIELYEYNKTRNNNRNYFDLEMTVNFKFYNIFIENQKFFTKAYPYIENNTIYLKIFDINSSFVEDEEFKNKLKNQINSKIDKFSTTLATRYKEKINKKIEDTLNKEKEDIVLKIKNILKNENFVLYSSNNILYDIDEYQFTNNNIKLELNFKLKIIFMFIFFISIIFFTIFYKIIINKIKNFIENFNN